MMGEKSNIQIVLNSGSMFLGTLVLACQTICYRKPEDHNRNLHWSGMSNLVWSVTLWLCIHFFLSMLSDTGSLLSTGNSSKKLIHSHVHSSDLKGKKTRTALPVPVKVTNWRDNVCTVYDKDVTLRASLMVAGGGDVIRGTNSFPCDVTCCCGLRP